MHLVRRELLTGVLGLGVAAVGGARVAAEPGATESGDVGDIVAVAGAARLIAIGEHAHGDPSLLALRNGWIRKLIERGRVSAIALETGFAEALALNALVMGRATEDISATINAGMTWGFGALKPNQDLLAWLSAHNAGVEPENRVAFHGLDLSLAGPTGCAPLRAPFDLALRYLKVAGHPAAGDLGARLEPFLAKAPASGAPFAIEERRALLAQAVRLERTFATGRPPRSSHDRHDFDEARQAAVTGRWAAQVFVEEPAPEPSIPAGAWRPMATRNAAMAQIVSWIERRESPRGRTLIHAHNMHVANASLRGGRWAALDRPPSSLGRHLRAMYGAEACLVGTSPLTGPGSLGAWAEAAGLANTLVDLRRPHADSLDREQSLTTDADSVVLLTPSNAFDAMAFL